MPMRSKKLVSNILPTLILSALLRTLIEFPCDSCCVGGTLAPSFRGYITTGRHGSWDISTHNGRDVLHSFFMSWQITEQSAQGRSSYHLQELPLAPRPPLLATTSRTSLSTGEQAIKP